MHKIFSPFALQSHYSILPSASYQKVSFVNMAPIPARQYDIVLLGATGYTGKLCAQHITTNLPTNLRWAVAGRSEAKLSQLITDLKPLNADRVQPGLSFCNQSQRKPTDSLAEIEIAALIFEELNTLAKKTKVLLNTIGPYHLYSTPVVEACVNSGTHYLDVTGETPWVLEIISKYHDTAKAKHAIIIPEMGIESSPSDLLAWSLTDLLRKKCSTGTKDITAGMKISGMASGGTLKTIGSLLGTYSMKEMAAARKPWAFSPVPGPKASYSPSLFTRILGVRHAPEIGILTTSIFGGGNTAIVQRSWGLLDDGALYGRKFEYHEYLRVGSTIMGVVIHIGLVFTAIAMAFSPFRWLFGKIAYAPGTGPSQESHSKELLDIRAIATADENGSRPRRALGRLRYTGGMYYLSGIFLAEAAMVLLNDDALTAKLDGGVLTPAMLGQPFIDRLRKSGLVIETEMLPYE